MRLLLLSLLVLGVSLAQEPVTKPPLSPRVLDPISLKVAEPEMPMSPDFEVDVDEYENPLLLLRDSLSSHWCQSLQKMAFCP